MSRHAQELLDGLLPHLTGPEATRPAATKAAVALATRCSDGGSLEPAVGLLVDTLAGKGLKLTTWEQRAAVLGALGTLSQAPLGAASKAALAARILEALLQFIGRESHEGTQAEAAVMLSTFSSPSTVPAAAVVTALREVLDNAKTRHSVLLGVLQSSHAFYSEEGKTPFVDSLLRTLEKLPAPSSHFLVPSEAVIAAHLLLRTTLYDTTLLPRITAAKWWNALADTTVLGEKFVQTASESVLLVAVQLAVGLLEGSFSVQLTASQQGKWMSVLVNALVYGKWSARKLARSKLQNLLTQADTFALTKTALASLESILNTISSLPVSEEAGVPTNNIVVKALRALAYSSDAHKQDLFLSLVLLAHHPVLVGTASLLPSLCKAAGLDFSELLSTNAEAVGHVLVMALSEAAPSRVASAGKAIQLLCSHPKAAALCNALLGTVVARLSDPAVDPIGPYECAVWRSKEGVLYSSSTTTEPLSALDPNSRDYAERKWEMEVRKELTQKKEPAKTKEPSKAGKDGGKDAASKLSKKQEEQARTQLAKESALRAEVTRVDSLLRVAGAVLSHILEGAPHQLEPSLAAIMAKLLLRTRSALFSQRACELYLKLSKCTTIAPPSLALSLAAVVLRARAPVHPLSRDWLIEPLDTMVARIMRSIWTCTHAAPFPPVSFVFSLPLIEYVLRSPVSTHAAAVLEDALVVLNSHVELGASAVVPHMSVLTLLAHVIAAHSRLAHQAAILLGDYCVHLATLLASSAPLPREEILDVLLTAMRSPSLELRRAAVRSLSSLPLPAVPSVSVVAQLWLGCYDNDETNAAAATKLWQQTGYTLLDGVVATLLENLASPHDDVRGMAARALAAAMRDAPSQLASAVDSLLARYSELLVEPKPLRDELGNLLPVQPADPWEGRSGVSEALAALAPQLQADQVFTVVSMFVELALADRHEKAQAAALKASIEVVDAHGKDNVAILLPIIEGRLATLSRSDGRQDIVRQSGVVLLGTLAKHLEKSDPKIRVIVDTLMSTLWTPSQPVQEAVANCLAPLAPAIKDDAATMLASLMSKLLDGEMYGTRRGAAHGIAGLVKGLSILALKQHGIIDKLLEAIQNKKSARHREGSLMALELLCIFLGRLFEPYVIHVLPHLLICYGDGNVEVRAAATNTAKAIMSKLSAHGVKLVLPALLAGLDDDSWRTKAGSVELLGAMANCAPKQLSACLPSIVPRLASVMTDSHAKVQQAGRDALHQITTVIKNPEVLAIAPTIMAALSDPANKTSACLEALLQTAFVHVIDAPSLAVLMPVLQRALVDRASDTKMRASQIIGNMYSLTDPKDLTPYVESIIPGLQQALTDPTPEVRAVASKALGAMFKGMGEANSGGLVPWLLETMRSNTNTVDRAGAAQGLSEVLLALGVPRLEALMDSFIAGTTSTLPYVREGHFLLFVYLPATFGELFSSFVARVVPCVLRGLADMEETVRDAATRTAQRIISHFSDQSVELLLPELEAGMQHEHWRIRQSSIHLLGDLLYKISGVSGNKTTEGDDDDNFGTEEARDAILGALGAERRDRVFSRLYVARSDTQLPVRQAAIHVWKVVITHTVRTLREAMSTLIALVLGCLASSEAHLRTPAARTLGELVKKLGERVLPDILPILEAGLDDPDEFRRQGVCIALVEIMECSNRELIGQFSASLIPSVQRALCDPAAAVREAAANTFSALHSCIGSQTIDDILPKLLAGLGAGDATSEAALDGLRLIMTAKSKVLLPFLVPQLLRKPISTVNAKALASLTAVAGASLARYTLQILETLLDELQRDSATFPDLREAARVVVLATEPENFTEVLQHLLAACGGTGRRRLAAVELLSAFCQDTAVDYSVYLEQILRGLLKLFADPNSEVLSLAWAAVSAVLTRSPADDKQGTLRSLHKIIRNLATDRDWAPLPGFALPRGLEPFIAVYIEGLGLAGIEIKELAAEGLGHLVRLTTADELGAYSMKITGPLIRLSSEGVWQVRAATLAALLLLLEKIPAKLKPFIPQLQPTCVKALKESSRVVRERATAVLTHLIKLQKDRRIDPLLTELNTAAKTAEPAVKVAIYSTLQAALLHAGATATEAALDRVRETLEAELDGAEDVRIAAGRALAGWVALRPDDSQAAFLKTMLNKTTAWGSEQARAAMAEELAWTAGNRPCAGILAANAVRWVRHEITPVSALGVSVSVALVHWACESGSPTPETATLTSTLASLLTSIDSTHDMLLSLLGCLVRLGRDTSAILPSVYAALLPPMMQIVRIKSGPVKLVSKTRLSFNYLDHRPHILTRICTRSAYPVGHRPSPCVPLASAARHGGSGSCSGRARGRWYRAQELPSQDTGGPRSRSQRRRERELTDARVRPGSSMRASCLPLASDWSVSLKNVVCVCVVNDHS